jgi:thiamine pyrophosphate-dependent acetolactate synthase large subunit-like protein
MKRVVCARLVKERLTPQDIVVCGLGSVEASYKEVGPVGPTYFASDPMGIWPAVALGLALARPDRRVVLLAGDGDLAMNLQILVTIASVAPKNLRIVLFQNGAYASAGGQPLGGAARLSFKSIADGAGFPWTDEARSEDETRRVLDALFARADLGLVAIHLEAEPCPAEPPGPWSQAEIRTQFMHSLQATTIPMA